MSFTEHLQSLRLRNQNDDAIVSAVRDWLVRETRRFIPVAVTDNDVELLTEPELGGWQVRRPPEHPLSRMLRHPADDLPGSRLDERGCNLGFKLFENGQLAGHFAWPAAFNREAVPDGMTPHQVRQHLLRLGHLHADQGRFTTHLPRSLARISAQAQVREVEETHSGGGLAYKKPIVVRRQNFKVRTLALRGLVRAA